MGNYETLSYLKTCKKLIEKEIEGIEKKLRAKEHTTRLGKFKRVIKTNPVFDTDKIISDIGEHKFIACSKPTKKGLIEILGTDYYEDMLRRKVITVQETKPSINFYMDKTIILPKFTLSVINDNSAPFTLQLNS